MRYEYVDDDFVVAVKPAGLPSAPISPGDRSSALSVVGGDFPDVLCVRGRKAVERGLVHRLDTATAGLLLFARNQAAYDGMLKFQDAGLFQKEYTAFCSCVPACAEVLPGFPPPPLDAAGTEAMPLPFLIRSRFRHYGPGRKQVRPVSPDSRGYALKKNVSGREYSTELLSVQRDGGRLVVRCRTARGFRHQVRCHLAWCGLPVEGDALYNPAASSSGSGLEDDAPGGGMGFFATGIRFPSLRSGREVRVEIPFRDLF